MDSCQFFWGESGDCEGKTAEAKIRFAVEAPSLRQSEKGSIAASSGVVAQLSSDLACSGVVAQLSSDLAGVEVPWLRCILRTWSADPQVQRNQRHPSQLRVRPANGQEFQQEGESEESKLEPCASDSNTLKSEQSKKKIADSCVKEREHT